MINNYTVATVFGGTGFIGRHIVRALADRGVIVKVATRVPERAFFLKPYGRVGQIVPFACRYDSPESLKRAVQGSDIVVNCVGILFERGKRKTFKRVHVDFAAAVARACSEAGVARLVHLSALGCDKATSKYAASKLEGEGAIFSNFPQASILRPGPVFGTEDRFFNLFAELSRYIPFMPLIGGGRTKMQPVYVGDVSQAAMACLYAAGEGPHADVEGKVFELGGPDVLSMKDIYENVFHYCRRKRLMITIPWPLAKLQAWFLSFMPRPILTPDQVETLRTDCVVSEGAKGFKDLEMRPCSVDGVLPSYLEVYQSGGRLACARD